MIEPTDRLPESLEEISTPSLVLDVDILERNIERMARRMADLGVRLRPHCKTHKCFEVASAQQQHGAAGFTVSTLSEARFLMQQGIQDLTWAFPVILNRIADLQRLPADATLRLVVDSPVAISVLERQLSADGQRFHVWLKVDCGYHRAGVDPEGPAALELAGRLQDSESLIFDGILSHSGHAYDQRTRAGLLEVAEEERRVMVHLASRLRGTGIDCPGVSIGSTPAMSVVENLEGITEARPGNYVFYDHTQVQLGACSVSDCALSLMASVVSSQPGAGHCVIDAGALSLSKDPGPHWTRPRTFGEIYTDYRASELAPDVRVVSLSQEHGIVNAPLAVGQRLRILPNHSCLAVPCFDDYVLARGDMIVGRAPIWRH